MSLFLGKSVIGATPSILRAQNQLQRLKKSVLSSLSYHIHQVEMQEVEFFFQIGISAPESLGYHPRAAFRDAAFTKKAYNKAIQGIQGEETLFIHDPWAYSETVDSSGQKKPAFTLMIRRTHHLSKQFIRLEIVLSIILLATLPSLVVSDHQNVPISLRGTPELTTVQVLKIIFNAQYALEMIKNSPTNLRAVTAKAQLRKLFSDEPNNSYKGFLEYLESSDKLADHSIVSPLTESLTELLLIEHESNGSAPVIGVYHPILSNCINTCFAANDSWRLFSTAELSEEEGLSPFPFMGIFDPTLSTWDIACLCRKFSPAYLPGATQGEVQLFFLEQEFKPDSVLSYISNLIKISQNVFDSWKGGSLTQLAAGLALHN